MLVRRKFFIWVILILILIGLYPVMAQAETEESSKQVMVLKVEKGESFWSIGKDLDLDVELIAAMNDLTPEAPLQIGQVLVLPADRTFVYRVQEGDNLWALAHKFKASQNQIILENELTDIEKLQVGQSLIIPLPVRKEESQLAMSKEFYPSRGFRTAFFKWPVNGVISSSFGPRDGRIHEGLDIAKESGSSIKAARGGRVAFAGWRGAYGKAVIIDHGDGVRTLYAHASKLLVSEGEHVSTGQLVARVGNTGRSTGPHIHFEVLYQGTALDPLKFLPGRE